MFKLYQTVPLISYTFCLTNAAHTVDNVTFRLYCYPYLGLDGLTPLASDTRCVWCYSMYTAWFALIVIIYLITSYNKLLLILRLLLSRGVLVLQNGTCRHQNMYTILNSVTMEYDVKVDLTGNGIVSKVRYIY